MDHKEHLMSTITTTDGTQIFYKDWGEGQPVVFSHGWSLNADAWDDQAMLVASNGFRAIAPDRRAHGRSSQPWTGHELNTYADDLAQLLDTLDVRDAVLIGHSTGGGEVTRYIGRHGTDRVAKALLLGAIPPLMLKTDANPVGTPIEAFDAIRQGVASDRSQFYKDLSTPFAAPTERAQASRRGFVTRSGSGACRLGSRAPTTASRPSRRPTSPTTSGGSTCPP
jgi:non-heme chloroperoxidase